MSTTKAKDLAGLLENREYRNEMTTHEIREAASRGLVVIFGASDDLIELEGAISEELSEGKFILIPAGETVEIYDDEEERTFVEGKKDRAVAVQLRDDAKDLKNLVTGEYGTDGVWRFVTDIPHSIFNIMEDDALYCVGIVIDLEDLKEPGKFITQEDYDELTSVQQWQYIVDFKRRDLVTVELDNDITYFLLNGYDEREDTKGYVLSPADWVGNDAGVELLLKALGFNVKHV